MRDRAHDQDDLHGRHHGLAARILAVEVLPFGFGGLGSGVLVLRFRVQNLILFSDCCGTAFAI